jgi:hypothetical protein
MMFVIVGVCRDCGKPMVGKHTYRRYAEAREQFVRHDGQGLCRADHKRATAHGTLPEPAPRDLPRCAYRRRAEVLEEYALLRSDGVSRRMCALRMGMTLSGLDRAINRARAAGERVAA